MLPCIIWSNTNLVHIMITSSKYGAQSRLHACSNRPCYRYVIVSKQWVRERGQLPCVTGLYRGLRYANCLLRHSLPCNELLNNKPPHRLSDVATWLISSSTPKCNLKFSKFDIHYTNFQLHASWRQPIVSCSRSKWTVFSTIYTCKLISPKISFPSLF